MFVRLIATSVVRVRESSGLGIVLDTTRVRHWDETRQDVLSGSPLIVSHLWIRSKQVSTDR